MKTLLALFLGSANQRRLVERFLPDLSASGVRVVVADDWIEPLPCFRDGLADVLRVPPPGEITAVVRACEAYARTHSVHGVLAPTESAILPGALVARRLGVPGLPLRAAEACVNKHLTRELLARGRVPCPRFALAESVRDVTRFASGCYPVFLKAVASTMGRLVTRVNREADASTAVDRLRAGLAKSGDIQRLVAFATASDLTLDCDPTRQFLVESCAVGTPVETDGVVVAATPHFYGVTEQVHCPPPHIFMKGYLLPAEEQESARIIEVSRAALSALGVRDACFSIELRAHDDTVEVIEVNGRVGQDDGFGEFHEFAGGREGMALAIDVALGRPLLPPQLGVAHWALAFQSWYAGGVVERVPTAAEIQAARAEVTALGLCVERGDVLHAAPDPETFPHLAWAVASDARSSRAAYVRASATVDSLRFSIASREH
ncbi:MAG: acetyl-CoA carboxylase biotin carboxylase subunit family protein [Planctomycetota bacterium]